MRYDCTREEEVEVGELGSFETCAEFNGVAPRWGRRKKERTMKGQKKTSAAKRAPFAEIGYDGDDAGLGDGFFDFGDPGELSPVWGSLLGAGLAGGGVLTAKAMRKTHPRVAKYAGVVGLLAGGVPSTVALFFHQTRRAGLLGLGVSAIVGVSELIRSLYVEPQFGLYQPEMTGAGLEILGEDVDGGEADEIAAAMMQGALGAGVPLEIMGQSTPQQAMAGLGLYQPEMTGANPLEVMGAVQPFSGMF